MSGGISVVVLQTERLTLSPCQPSDCADFVALERDPEVMRYLNGGRPVDRATCGPDSLFLMPDGTEPHLWTARRNFSGDFVGWFCLWRDSDTQAELGYRLQRRAWGQGLATEGASALVNWGFTGAGYEKILSTTMTVNHGSRRVLEKLGFSCVRTISVDWPDPFPGCEHGEVWYELMRADWRGRAPAVDSPRVVS